jgi:hypothetical protein
MLAILQIFIELFVIAGIVAIAMSRYEDVFSPYLPAALAAAVGYVTWKHLLSTEKMKRYFGRWASRSKMAYIVVFIGAGMLGIAYLWGAKKTFAKLDSLELIAKKQKEHPVQIATPAPQGTQQPISNPSPASAAPTAHPIRPSRHSSLPVHPDPSHSLISSMSNARLQESASKLANDLRLFGAQWDEREKELSQKLSEINRMTNMQEHDKLWNQNTDESIAMSQQRTRFFDADYRGRVIELRDEMLRRIPVEDQPTSQESQAVEGPLNHGALAGTNPVGDVADYLELLARRLPVQP